MTKPLVILSILSLHAASVAMSASLPEAIAPFVAGTVYLPLWALASLGLPVFGAAPAGGWAGPNAAGWAVLLACWGIFWWALVEAGARLLKRCGFQPGRRAGEP